jgi:murein DD-endopeptidase MepM/ murein hydrolase activator NlpD
VFQVKAGDTENPEAAARATFMGASRALEPLRGVSRALMAVPASTRPGTYPVTVRIAGKTLKTSVTVRYKRFPSQNIHMKPGKTSLMDPKILARERRILNAAYDTFTPQPLWTGAFIVPSPGSSTSAWGRRRTVNGRPWGQHQGADIAAGTGVPVKATNAGEVVVAQKLWMRGNTVVLDHGLGVFSVYNHLSRLDVRPGDRVARGQLLGAVGATGFVTGPHLHWEMRIGRISVNPWPIVKSGLPLG